MKKKKYLAAVLAFACVCLVFGGIYVKVIASSEKDKICNGVFINSVDVGGMTGKEAKAAVDKYVNNLKEKKLTIQVGKKKITSKLGDLGFDALENDYITQALNVGKTGNLIKRYKELKDVEHNQLVYKLQFTLDDLKLNQLVNEKCSQYNITPVNATITRKNGEFIVTDDKIGRKVEVDETTQKIKSAVLEDWKFKDVTLNAVIIDDVPEHTKDMLLQCKDLLGQFSTTYATSSQSRANNLANAARLINGTVIYPGETFSTGDKIQPITQENGYSMASAYQNGKVVDSVGGGVCQVATTLYNAVLRSELEIVERSNHSMIVGYVKPAMDAAIAGDYKDLKFKNNTEVPIYIDAYTVGREITFRIYGKETRDTINRKVEFESEVTQVIQPGKEKITKDPTKPLTYREVTQEAHVGYKANLWKIVYENGVEVSREKVNSSSYAAVPAYVIVGSKKPEKKVEVKPSPSPEADPEGNIEDDTTTGKDNVPKAEEKPVDEQSVDDTVTDAQ